MCSILEKEFQVLLGFWAEPVPRLCDRKVLECPELGSGTRCHGRASDQETTILFSGQYNARWTSLLRLDYSKFAPPYSYIDIKDFETPQHLAEYLHFLEKNPKEYLAYFWWKDHYVPKFGSDVNGNTWCELCRKLNNPNEPESVFRNYDSFLRCEEPKWGHVGFGTPRQATLFDGATKPIQYRPISWRIALLL